MKQEIFDDCLNHWIKSDGHTEFWKELSLKWNYPTSESIRQEFKYERRKRGIKKEQVVREIKEKIVPHSAKILLLDIETSLINAFVFDVWQQDIRADAIVQDWYIICWSAKWLFDDHIMSDCITSSEALLHDDKRICSNLWDLLDKADIVIGHNVSSFDIPKINTRFLINGMVPPASYKIFDTLNMVRKEFGSVINKLDYWNKILGLPQKIDAPFKLWVDCFYGDRDALNKMQEYNKNDVDILEDFYLKILPFAKNHPNLNLWSKENVSVCPNCGHSNLDWHGYYYTITGYYKSFRCLECGAIGRSRQNEVPKEKRKVIAR